MAIKDIIADLKTVQTEGPKAFETVRSVGEEANRINREAAVALKNIDKVISNPAAALTPQQAAGVLLQTGGGGSTAPTPVVLVGPNGRPISSALGAGTISAGPGGGGGGRLVDTRPVAPPAAQRPPARAHRVPPLLQGLVEQVVEQTTRRIAPQVRPGPNLFINGPSRGERAIEMSINNGFRRLEEVVTRQTDQGALFRSTGGLR